MQIIEHSIIGTRSAVLRLRRPGSALQFVLFPMLHIADPAFYREVTRRLRETDLVIAEGVRGSSALTTGLTLTYRVIPANRRSGLVTDDIDYRSLGVPVLNHDASSGEVEKSWRALPWRFRLLVWLLMPYLLVFQLVGGRRRLLCPDIEVSDLPTRQDELAGEDLELFEEALVDKRDEGLRRALGEIVRTRSDEPIVVAVVYGARHMPGIVEYLMNAHGYRVREADWITVIAA